MSPDRSIKLRDASHFVMHVIKTIVTQAKGLNCGILPASIVLLLAGCSCEKSEQTHSNFSEFKRAFVPFSGSETLTYIQDGIDTVRFKGEGSTQFYTTKEMGGGNCPVDHKMLNQQMAFYNHDRTQQITFHYFIDGENSNYNDFFHMQMTPAFQYGPINVPHTIVLGKPLISISVLGRSYNYVHALSTNVTDSAYYTGNAGLINCLIRIKRGEHVYELIPQ